MKNKSLKWTFLALAIVLSHLNACKKSSFLDAKTEQSHILLNTLNDHQMLLDNVVFMNGYGVGLVPGLAEASSDNYYIYKHTFRGLSEPFYKYQYIWDDNLFLGSSANKRTSDWNSPYKAIFYANLVLDGIEKLKIEAEEQLVFNQVKGSALFYRAHALYHLAQIFAPVYDAGTSGSDLGIILKTSGDINEKPGRSSVQKNYDFILTELKEAANLLPDQPLGGLNSRPSKAAAFGLLARTYMSMQNYPEALEYADKCLGLYSVLNNYNDFSINDFFPFPIPRNNKEIIFYASSQINVTNLYNARIDRDLYTSYLNDDMRKFLFYGDAVATLGLDEDEGYFFRGSYEGSDALFAGIATDEIYLMRAECYARQDNVPAAMADLNKLLKTRWKKDAVYIEITAASSSDALDKVLKERRKELVFRGLRWMDLRRLNKEGASISISRTVDGVTYTLSPNSKKYTFLIPQEVLDFNPGMKQNPR